MRERDTDATKLKGQLVHELGADGAPALERKHLKRRAQRVKRKEEREREMNEEGRVEQGRKDKA